MIRRRVTLVALAAVSACSEFVATVRQVEPGVLAVNTASRATLEMLDWGGNGPTLVFLAGAGHTAHEFDEFAPRLTDNFRAIGITRRGVGASSNFRRRVARDAITDIARVLDALELESVVLVGHSQGGREAALFAQLYPDPCVGIVHLDLRREPSSIGEESWWQFYTTNAALKEAWTPENELCPISLS